MCISKEEGKQVESSPVSQPSRCGIFDSFLQPPWALLSLLLIFPFHRPFRSNFTIWNANLNIRRAGDSYQMVVVGIGCRCGGEKAEKWVEE